MTGGRRTLAAFVAVMVFSLAAGGCGLNSYGYRYRVTVDIDTPQGVRSGSSVWEIRRKEGSGFPDTSSALYVYGEAVAVHLPNGTVYALLRRANMNESYAGFVVAEHYHNDLRRASGKVAVHEQNLTKKIAEKKPSFDLLPDEYPLLVYFPDPSMPSSVTRLERDDLSAVSPGARVARVHIEVTTDDVTHGIVKDLPWLKDWRTQLASASSIMPADDAPFATRVNGRDFIQEGRQ